MGDGPNDRGASRYHILSGVEASLRRLKTDHIDLYQIHNLDPGTPLDETLRALDDLVRAGKVRYIGASNFQAWQLARANDVAEQMGWEPFVSVQPHYQHARAPHRARAAARTASSPTWASCPTRRWLAGS